MMFSALWFAVPVAALSAAPVQAPPATVTIAANPIPFQILLDRDGAPVSVRVGPASAKPKTAAIAREVTAQPASKG